MSPTRHSSIVINFLICHVKEFIFLYKGLPCKICFEYRADVGLIFDAFQNLFFGLQYSFGAIVTLKLEGTMIRGPTWCFRRSQPEISPCGHPLNWKNSPLSKTCFCTLLISAPLFWFLILVPIFFCCIHFETDGTRNNKFFDISLIVVSFKINLMHF